MEPLALSVWTECAATVGTFLPLKTEPEQVFGHRRDKFSLATRAVEVFVAQHERAAEFLRALLGNPKSASVAEVQVTGGRRRDRDVRPERRGSLWSWTKLQTPSDKSPDKVQIPRSKSQGSSKVQSPITK